MIIYVENSEKLRINYKEVLREFTKIFQHKSIYPIFCFTYQLKQKKIALSTQMFRNKYKKY